MGFGSAPWVRVTYLYEYVVRTIQLFSLESTTSSSEGDK
jgi:hypothetical protein